ncbi:MAG: hypothetical protein K2X66_14990, partial [Cyanobacteria bacterium]|nr:hypothetical protein [Cyanobacteriota bacterium]
MTAPATRPTALPSPVAPKTPGPNSGKPVDATPADAPKVVAKPAVKVDGSTGPYNPDKPGGFGANASENFKTL